MNRTCRIVAISFLTTALCAITGLGAAPGDLDISFGPNSRIPGTANVHVPESAGNTASDLVVQDDGRVIAVGSATGLGFALVRYEMDGSIDLSFGENGFAVTDLGGQDSAHGAALQADGRIVVVGESWLGGGPRLAVVRYNPDGSLDNTFGSDGIMILAYATPASANDVLIQADGKILVVGTGLEWHVRAAMLLIRLHPDGTLDTGFGTDGVVSTDFGLSAQGRAVGRQSDNKIVIGGVAWDIDEGGWSFAAARYDINGKLDTGFGNQGKAIYSPEDPNADCHDMVVQPDDKILMGGQAYIDGSTHFKLVRLTAGGSLDASFGNNGVVATDIYGGLDSCRALSVLDDGSILAAGGASEYGTVRYFVMMKYDETGEIDTEFGEDGLASTFLWGAADAIAVDGDRVYLAGGGGYGPGQRGHCVACYTLTGYRSGGSAPGAFLMARENKTADPEFIGAHWDYSGFYPGIAPETIVVSVDGPFFGSVEVHGDGTLTYYPQRHHRGYDAFFYTDLDGRVGIVVIYMITSSIKDYDGDGLTDPVIYHETTGCWHVLLSGSGYEEASLSGFGGAGWLPVSGDFDGDGKTDPAIYEEATGTWRVLLSGSGYGEASLAGFGGPGWLPVSGDFDGDGKTDLAIYDQVTGTWRVLLSSSGYGETSLIAFGGPGWVPVPSDFDGDGKTDPAIYLEETGEWLVMLSGDNYSTTRGVLGGSGYIPVSGDFDGDGRADPAVYNEESGHWRIQLSDSEYESATFYFGGPGYAPVCSYTVFAP